MNPVRQLQEGRREFSLPAELVLADGETLLCVEMLRVLPGKRAVMKACWRGKVVLVKLTLNTASGRWAVRRELAGYGILDGAGIRTPKLWFGTGCANEGHVLAFEFLQRARTLGELWRGQAHRRMDIATSGLDLMARLHRKGCSHGDPHLDNFLLVDERIYVVDAASIKSERSRGCGAWQRKNRALFLAQFTPLWQQKLLDVLAEKDAATGGDPKLPKAVARAWRRRKSRYLKKCFRECGEFSTQRTWRQVSVYKRAEQCDDLDSFLKNPDDWVEKSERLKDGTSATVVCATMGGRRVIIRRNNIKHFRHRLQRCLRPTRSHINWRNAHLLKISGIATPEPIAFVEKRWGFFRGRGYYVCAFVDSPSAGEKYASQPPSERELARFSDLFSGMRLARLYHGDLKASNLLVTEEDIVLIDLDSMRNAGRGGFWFRKDRRRFLENWKDKPEQRSRFAEIF